MSTISSHTSYLKSSLETEDIKDKEESQISDKIELNTLLEPEAENKIIKPKPMKGTKNKQTTFKMM